MTIIYRFAHGNIQAYTQTAYHILVLISIIYKGMYYAYLFASPIEIEPYGKWQPCPDVVFMNSLHSDDGTYLSALFYLHLRQLRMICDVAG